MLPFNTRHLGASDYGLWMLAASIVAYFPVLDLGYGGAMERFVAHYRAQRNPRAINEIASTWCSSSLLSAWSRSACVAVIACEHRQLVRLCRQISARAVRLVMMLVGAQFAIGLPFAVFGAIVNGFQRQYLNAAVGGNRQHRGGDRQHRGGLSAAAARRCWSRR